MRGSYFATALVLSVGVHLVLFSWLSSAEEVQMERSAGEQAAVWGVPMASLTDEVSEADETTTPTEVEEPPTELPEAEPVETADPVEPEIVPEQTESVEPEESAPEPVEARQAAPEPVEPQRTPEQPADEVEEVETPTPTDVVESPSPTPVEPQAKTAEPVESPVRAFATDAPTETVLPEEAPVEDVAAEEVAETVEIETPEPEAVEPVQAVEPVEPDVPQPEVTEAEPVEPTEPQVMEPTRQVAALEATEPTLVEPEAVTEAIEGQEAVPLPRVRPDDVPHVTPPPPQRRAEQRPEPRREQSQRQTRQRQQAQERPAPAQRQQSVAAPSGGARGTGGRRQADGGQAALSNYSGQVVAKLQRAKRYPREAARQRLGGTATVTFTVTAGGGLAGARLARSSGQPVLDREALATVQRAAPFPPIPPAAGRSSMTFTVPIRFSPR